MPSARSKLNPPQRKPSLSLANPAVADVTVADFRLDGRPMDAIVEPLEISLNRAIDGASTISATIADPAVGDPPRSVLLNSGVLAKAVDLVLDDLAFRLADIDLADNDGGVELDLVFESTPVARLRRQTGAKHASRMDKTRAEFIKSLCDEIDVPFVCPDLHKRQPIQSVEDAMTPQQRKAERHKGIKSGADITVKGVRADSEQLGQIQRANDVADSLSAPALAQLAMNCAAIGESGYRAVKNAAGSKYRGVFQWAGDQSDTEAQAHYFLKGGQGFQQGGAIALATAHPDMSPGEIAARVEASGESASFYDAHRDEASKIMQAFGASGSLDVAANAAPETYAVPYMFRRLGAEEAADGIAVDSWKCMRDLADEVHWRLWESGGRIFYMTDDRILRSRPDMTVSPGVDGIDSVTGRLSNRKERQELTVQCHARRWQAGPGDVAEVIGYGKFDGRWIVATVNRPSLFRNDTTVTLQQRVKATLEPSHETATRSAGPDAVDSSGVDIGSGAFAAGAPSGGSPKRVVDTVVLPIANEIGVRRTVAENDAANARHGPTASGNHSDHQGPPDKAWAADLPCTGATGDRLAAALAKRFGFKGNGSGSFVRVVKQGYSVQILWKVDGHYDHVHCGIQKVGPTPLIVDSGDILDGSVAEGAIHPNP